MSDATIRPPTDAEMDERLIYLALTVAIEEVARYLEESPASSRRTHIEAIRSLLSPESMDAMARKVKQ